MAQSMQERLDSYPTGARVKDAVKDIWEKKQDGRWGCVSKDGAIDMTTAELIFAWAPISRKLPEPKMYFLPGKTDNTPPTVAELEAATELTEVTVLDTDFSWTGDKTGIQGDLENMTVELSPSSFVAPTQLEMEEHAAKFGLSMQETAEAFEMLGKILGESYASPKEELKFRINSWLRDEDPGLPVNWPGIERAMARL